MCYRINNIWMLSKSLLLIQNKSLKVLKIDNHHIKHPTRDDDDDLNSELRNCSLQLKKITELQVKMITVRVSELYIVFCFIVFLILL